MQAAFFSKENFDGKEPSHHVAGSAESSKRDSEGEKHSEYKGDFSF